ncbi:transcriptional enhancer factor TEF-3-like, partial [Scleropages formosus]
VSSHIQVLARRKAREIQVKLKGRSAHSGPTAYTCQHPPPLFSVSSLTYESRIHSRVPENNEVKRAQAALNLVWGTSTARMLPGTAQQGIVGNRQKQLQLQEYLSCPSVGTVRTERGAQPPEGRVIPTLTALSPPFLQDQVAKDKALQSMASMSSAQIISTTVLQNKMALQGLSRPAYPTAPGVRGHAAEPKVYSHVKPFSQQSYTLPAPAPPPITGYESAAGLSASPNSPPWQGRSIASSKLRMLEFSAFLEYQQDPETYNKHLFVHIGQSNPSFSDPYLEAVDIRQIYDKFPERKGGLKELFEKGPVDAFFLADLSTNLQDDSSAFYGVSSQYESSENMIITSSTKVCSFGKQVVEKVETEYARFEGGRYVFRIHRSPLCEYMINFIHKLKHLPEKYMMNSVLENFTILQVVTNRDTLETLLCIAYVFEVSTSEHGAQHHIYRLVKD